MIYHVRNVLHVDEEKELGYKLMPATTQQCIQLIRYGFLDTAMIYGFTIGRDYELQWSRESYYKLMNYWYL